MAAVGLWFGTNMAMDKAQKDGLDPDIINRVLNWMIVGIFVGGHLGHALFMSHIKPLVEMTQRTICRRGSSIPCSSFGMVCPALVDSLSPALCWVFFRKENRRIIRENKKRTQENEASEEKNLFFFRFAPFIMETVSSMDFPWPLVWAVSDVFLHTTTQVFVVTSPCSERYLSRCMEQYSYRLSRFGTVRAIWACSLIPIVYFINKAKPRFRIFFAFIPMYYGPVRFFDYLRTNDVRYLGLTPAQYGALLLFCVVRNGSCDEPQENTSQNINNRK